MLASGIYLFLGPGLKKVPGFIVSSSVCSNFLTVQKHAATLTGVTELPCKNQSTSQSSVGPKLRVKQESLCQEEHPV